MTQHFDRAATFYWSLFFYRAKGQFKLRTTKGLSASSCVRHTLALTLGLQSAKTLSINPAEAEPLSCMAYYKTQACFGQ